MYEEMVKRQQREKEAESSTAAIVACFIGVLYSWPKILRNRNGYDTQRIGEHLSPQNPLQSGRLNLILRCR